MKEHLIFIGKVAAIAVVVVIAYNYIAGKMSEKSASKAAIAPNMTPTASVPATTSPAVTEQPAGTV